jgi:hypothetical protein
MPFYIRKAISLGPLRFNLSKSGIGVSVGIKGFRVGSGARGNYVHAGRGGLYYRKGLPGEPVASATLFKSLAERAITRVRDHVPTGSPTAPSVLSKREYESVSALEMQDATAEDLLRELKSKRAYSDSWPVFAVLAVTVVGGLITAGATVWIWLPAMVGGAALCIWRYERDQIERFAVSMYELDPEFEAQFRQFFSVFERLSNCTVWHVVSESASSDAKRAGGASSIVLRTKISPKIGTGPALLKTNVPVPQIPVGHQTLHFLPDRVLIEAPEGFGAVNYSDLVVAVTQEKFLESGAVPPGAKVIDKSWRYKNKEGGPDRRFKDNREIPVVLYERIHFKSASGLNELIQVSQLGLGDQLRQSLIRLG